jgi:hypothetical protein
VFVVGAFLGVLHYDGTAWVVQSSPAADALFGVWGSSGTQVIAVGDFGTVLRGSR